MPFAYITNNYIYGSIFYKYNIDTVIGGFHHKSFEGNILMRLDLNGLALALMCILS